MKCQKNNFREDLYYRLNVFPITLLPLRERTDDVLPLAKHFIKKNLTDQVNGIEITKQAEQKLLNYRWPGNIRELENVIQRALILSSGEDISAKDIEFFDVGSTHQSEVQIIDEMDESRLNQGMQAHEHELILSALEKNSCSRKKTANELGISPRTLRYKLAKMRDVGIDIPGDSIAHTA